MNARVGAIASEPRAGVVGLVRDLVLLTKPRITVMVILTGLGGMGLAMRAAGASVTWSRALAALAGLALVVSSANALNMYLERDVDGLMERTRQRPLPAGRLSPPVALWFGLAIGVGAVPLFAWQVNVLTAGLAALALVLYVLVYTPLKQVTPWALCVGAVPGAMPPLLGWTAATGSVDALGVVLFAVLFFWQMPHFLAIAMFRRDEYTGAGIQVFPARIGASATRAHAIAYLVALVIASLALVPLGAGGRLYAAAALALGLGFLVVCLREPAGDPGMTRWARSVFFASLVYLPTLMVAIVMGAL